MARGRVSLLSRLIVTIARKGYQFTANVTVGEAANTTIQAAGPADNAVPKALRRWWKAAFVGGFAVLLVVVGFASWRRFVATPPTSQKIMLQSCSDEHVVAQTSGKAS